MVIGMTMPARLPAKLTTPPVTPIKSTGATSETTAHDIDETPWAKNAKDRIAKAKVLELVKLARKIVVARTKPVTIGALRAKDRLAPRLSRASDQAPPTSTPT